MCERVRSDNYFKGIAFLMALGGIAFGDVISPPVSTARELP